MSQRLGRIRHLVDCSNTCSCPSGKCAIPCCQQENSRSAEQSAAERA